MLLQDVKPQIAFITESWLDSSITDGLIDPNGSYAVYRHDRLHRVGGGVMALVSVSMHSYQIKIQQQFSHIEAECFEIITHFGKCRFIVLYRPPEFNALGRQNMAQLYDCLCYLCDVDYTVVIVGDLNLPNIDWSVRSAPDDDIHSLFLKFSNNFGLSQFVSSPTRDANVLDLVMSNDPYVVSKVDVVDPFSNSDHCAINFSLVLTAHETQDFTRHVYDFDNCDVDGLCQALMSHPLQSRVVEGSADNAWDQFLSPISDAIAVHVPLKVYYPNRKYIKTKRYPRHITRALRKKLKLWRKYKNDKCVAHKVQYYEQCHLCKALIFEFERTKELNVIGNGNIGTFYRYINRRLSCKSGVGPLKSPTGETVTDDTKKAALLNDYFSSVFTRDNGVCPEFKRRLPSGLSLGSFDITPDIILKFVRKCKTGTSPGPDGIPQSFLKQFISQLLLPLTELFKYLRHLGHMPSQWKTANITPVFKKGLSSEVSNYRPISLTSIFCKLFERLIQNKILTYLSDNNLISPHQHGFLTKHSTCSQLLETVNDWSIALRNKHVVDVVYFDFAKAFDTVSHVKLISKLQAYGIDGTLLSIITDFLTDRSQRVVLRAGTSAFSKVVSGVPQGSVLGPLLFLLYINDITDLFPGHVSIKLFADDIKIYMEINNISDAAVFQNSINLVCEWAKMWQLKLATTKCQYMRVGLRRTDTSSYSLNGVDLNKINSCSDLGVKFDSVLSFADHIDGIVFKAKQRANQILRCFVSRDKWVLTKAFAVFVRPLLEYCSPVWSPCTVTAINKLESVQRMFTKRLPDMMSLSYDARLQLLGLERLELRRIHSDLIMCFKITHQLVSIPFSSMFELSASRATRGHPFKLAYPDSRINVRANSFPVRVIALWNRLPEYVVMASRLTTFKRLLRTVNMSYAILGKS